MAPDSEAYGSAGEGAGIGDTEQGGAGHVDQVGVTEQAVAEGSGLHPVSAAGQPLTPG